MQIAQAAVHAQRHTRAGIMAVGCPDCLASNSPWGLWMCVRVLTILRMVREEVARVQARDVEVQALVKSIEKQQEDNRYLPLASIWVHIEAYHRSGEAVAWVMVMRHGFELR